MSTLRSNHPTVTGRVSVSAPEMQYPPHGEEQAIVDYHENMMDYIYNEGPSDDDYLNWREANEYLYEGEDYDGEFDE